MSRIPETAQVALSRINGRELQVGLYNLYGFRTSLSVRQTDRSPNPREPFRLTRASKWLVGMNPPAEASQCEAAGRRLGRISAYTVLWANGCSRAICYCW
jgi:hypothetical protein